MKSKKLPVLIAALLVLSLAANGYLFYSLHQQQGQTAALMERHTAQLEELAKEQAAQLETLTADHAAELERLNQDHAAEIAELKATLEAEIATLQENKSDNTAKPESPANAEPTAATTPTQSSKPTVEAPPGQNNGTEADNSLPPLGEQTEANMPKKPGYTYVPGFGYIEGEPADNSGQENITDDPSVWEVDDQNTVPGAY